MVSKNKTAKQLLIMFALMLAFMLLFSVSFLLMSPASDLALNHGQKWLQVLSGALFWTSFIAAYTLLVLVNVKRAKLAKHKKVSPKYKLPGIITFFSSKEAIVADVLSAVFLIAVVVCVAILKLNNMFAFVLISLLVLALQLRAVLNGENYRYIKSQMSGGKESNE